MVKPSIWILFAVLLIGLSGCFQPSHSKGGEPAPILEVIYRGIDCRRTESEPKAVWISNRQQLADIYNRITTSVLGSVEDKLLTIDFSRFGVLLIMMGQKPTGGFHLRLREKQVLIKGDKAQVHINWIEPHEDARVPQMISSPCLMLKLSKGDYSRIQVLDQSGHVRAEVSMDHV